MCACVCACVCVWEMACVFVCVMVYVCVLFRTTAACPPMLPRSHTAIVLVQPMCHLPTPALLRGCSSAGIPHNDKSVCHCHAFRHNTTASDVGSTPSSTRHSAAATALKHKRYVPNTVLHDAPLRTVSLLSQPPWRQRVLCSFGNNATAFPMLANASTWQRPS